MADLYELLRPIVDAAAAKKLPAAGGEAAADASAEGSGGAAAAPAEGENGPAVQRPAAEGGVEEGPATERPAAEGSAAEAVATEGAAAEGLAAGGGGGGGRPGWHEKNHLSSEELRQLAAIRESEGVPAAGDEDDESDLASEVSGDLDDLGAISVTEDGSIVVGGGDGAAPAAAAGTEYRMPEGPLRVALMGAPNAGKSTLLNMLLGYDRALTGPEPGLTRDATSEWAEWRGLAVQLVDTAGWARGPAALARHDDAGGEVAALTQGQVGGRGRGDVDAWPLPI
ncbi:GTP-binding protein EngA [Monoraphidium neglectum]|uniref:GTP-binding protein EngA n=1 Tax=Monoraphidium neglectum TaxID=145388 RepID=A0A0D2K5B1_9CHLO|nr:GTP-binding protein EngA [Monoraphidium neglectum]KIY91348.1 GTP-binding protein EngA [Monoraphidium neglectum]|eukprot:XP_013890368.1 GTP-binding protein EngA [Monoraphidium neglectum]